MDAHDHLPLWPCEVSIMTRKTRQLGCRWGGLALCLALGFLALSAGSLEAQHLNRAARRLIEALQNQWNHRRLPETEALWWVVIRGIFNGKLVD